MYTVTYLIVQNVHPKKLVKKKYIQIKIKFMRFTEIYYIHQNFLKVIKKNHLNTYVIVYVFGILKPQFGNGFDKNAKNILKNWIKEQHVSFVNKILYFKILFFF